MRKLSLFILISLFIPLSSCIPSSRILIIGDSHLGGTYGTTLDALVRQRISPLVHTLSWGGSVPRWYIEGTKSPWGSKEYYYNGSVRYGDKENTPRLKDLIANENPDAIVISLGTNFTNNDTIEEIEETTKSLAEMAHSTGKNCYWIGLPHLGGANKERAERTHEILRDAVFKTPCKWIDSFNYTEFPEGQGDGIHYDSAGNIGKEIAKNWARQVLLEVLR